MRVEDLKTISRDLSDMMIKPCMGTARMTVLSSATQSLLSAVKKYTVHLVTTNTRMKALHESSTPARYPSDGKSATVKLIPGGVRSQKLVLRYTQLDRELSKKEPYQPVFVNEYAPTDPKDAYEYFHELQLLTSIQLYHYSSGNYLGSLWFAWNVPSDTSEWDSSQQKAVIDKGEKEMTQYHTRSMRHQFVNRFSMVSTSSPAVMREMYQWLTGDVAAARDSVSTKVQQRLKLVLDTQDADLVFDLRHLNEGRTPKYDAFWDAVKRFINEHSLAAVDDRRHGTECHLAIAMSVRDLIEQVQKKNPDIPVPSQSWVSLQFAPKNRFWNTAVQHTGMLDLKHMVQTRQLRSEHIDAHYTACVFRYLKELAVMYREHAVMLCMDDKHAISIGEPGLPVAAVDCGRRVIVGGNTPLTVADHDFTKMKLVPSATLVVDIPDKIDGSFYSGQVDVTFKDAVFQASSPIRHVTELISLLKTCKETNMAKKRIVLLYTDGGPDHRLTYLSVKISLICLFRYFDLDYLVAARTGPMLSFRNPVERVMSIINLALQAVGLVREKMPPEFENMMSSASSMKDMRAKAKDFPEFQTKVDQSLTTVRETLNDLVGRLALKEKPFMTGRPASSEEIEEVGLYTRDIYFLTILYSTIKNIQY